jgi:hypothetical protein
MLRIPIPVALAVLIVAGAATVYFYVSVVQNPVQGAWSDQGDTTTYTYTVPAGGWVFLGTFGGSSITVSSNVTIDFRADVFTAQAWATPALPEGRWAIEDLYLVVNPDATYSLGQWAWAETCTGASAMQLSNGMYMYYPNYTAPGATCSRQWPPARYTIDTDGNFCAYDSHCWPSSKYRISLNGITSYNIKPPVLKRTEGRGTTVYYIYLRPVYGIWVRPSANASITVTIKP